MRHVVLGKLIAIDHVTSQDLNMMAQTVLVPVCSSLSVLWWNVPSMVDLETGLPGPLAPRYVDPGSRTERVNATVHLHSLEGRIVLVLARKVGHVS